MSDKDSQETHREAGTGERDVLSPPADESTSLQKAKLVPTSRNKDGKNPQDYRFWNTQPVPRLDDLSLSTENAAPANSHPDGAILPIASCQELAKAPPEPLIQGFEWCEIDVNEPSELLELQNLLYNHYVEDDDGSFRLNYSTDFLAWALRSPGWSKDWHIGVRTTSKNGKTAPVASCRYYHRTLDWDHLYKTGFSHLPRGSTALRQSVKYRLEKKTATKGLRKMEGEDLARVCELLNAYSSKHSLRQQWTEQEVLHHFCSEASKNIVSSFVVEVNGKITDFMSYYLLESTVLRSASTNETIRTAYLYYYAISPHPTPTSADLQATHIQSLIHDLLILAKISNHHVFNALTIMDNPLFLTQQKFEPGTSYLHFYLFNWRTGKVGNGVDEAGRANMADGGGVGVVML
ncbi:hypothetical protein E4T38_01573 [Aureobasidium subglaciale]|nr:hypothetical protein E4T38_01573 [Aureobasidium subglaciale]KAI5219101.1 hypothetical protein E4T40_06575 [Aureobasidium subglaciale]KAI5233189.1 hypothetical protein E4T41_01571 [Aureobasidium subglaciale]KAI5260100.1 hypothetical protein E4T46_06375 [Aureobasidium subglaciale]